MPTKLPTWKSQLWTRRSGRRGEDCATFPCSPTETDTLKYLCEVLAHQWRQYREQAAGIWALCAVTRLWSHCNYQDMTGQLTKLECHREGLQLFGANRPGRNSGAAAILHLTVSPWQWNFKAVVEAMRKTLSNLLCSINCLLRPNLYLTLKSSSGNKLSGLKTITKLLVRYPSKLVQSTRRKGKTVSQLSNAYPGSRKSTFFFGN